MTAGLSGFPTATSGTTFVPFTAGTHCSSRDACFSGGIFKTRGGLAESDKAIQELYSMPSRKAMTSGTLTEVPDHSTFLDYLTQRLQDNKQELYVGRPAFLQIPRGRDQQQPQYAPVRRDPRSRRRRRRIYLHTTGCRRLLNGCDRRPEVSPEAPHRRRHPI